MSAELIGRREELAAVERLLDAVPSGATGLFLEGEAGIGKTLLWQRALQKARARDYRVLSARPGGAEVQLAFAGLADLLGGALDDVLPGLAPPQRRALEIALLLQEARGVSPDQHAVSAAFASCLRILASDGPVLVAIDDVQWLDTSSRALLAFALRRLDAETVGVLATVRIARGMGVDDLVVTLPDDRIERRVMTPLTVAALYELVRERFGLSLARPTLLRLHELSGGNPFFALELARGLSESDELTVPRELSELLHARLRALSTPTQDVLLLAAALARPTREVLEQFDKDVSAALAEAEAAEIVGVTPGVIRFTHPLLASVHYESATPSARRTVHRRLADADLGAEERAHHLALAAGGPSEAVAQTLDEAVALARERGALASAAELAELAMAITPPTDPALHARSLAAADLRYSFGDAAGAKALLAQALERSKGDHERAEILFKQGFIAFETDETATVSLLSRALDYTGDDATLRADVLGNLAWAVGSLDSNGALEYAQEAVRVAESVGDPAVLARALGGLGQMQYSLAGDVPEDLMRRAIALEESTGHVSVEWSASDSYAQILLDRWDLDAARQIFERLAARARAEDSAALTFPLEKLAFVELCAGNLDRAAALAREAADLAAQGGRINAELYALFRLGWIEGLLGNVDLARELCARSLRLAEQSSGFFRGARLVLGVLESSLENYEAAWSYFDPANPLTGSMPPERPVFHVPESVEVLAALGRTGEARALLEPFAERADELRYDWAVAEVARCHSLILAAEGDLPRAETAAAEAVVLAAENRWPLPLGRALLALGTVQRQKRRKAEARATLQHAADVFEEMDARIWLERGHKELRRIGGRSASAGKALSTTEAQIVELVVAGRSNKEVAEALHLSPKTVEWNLSKIYRKFGVRSRTELAAVRSARD